MLQFAIVGLIGTSSCLQAAGLAVLGQDVFLIDSQFIVGTYV